MSHHRVAAGYLRTGNIDLAVVELEGIRGSWAKVTSLPRPAAFRDEQRYTSTMLEIAARLLGATLVLNMGRVDVARESLDAVRKSLADLRRENGVTVLASASSNERTMQYCVSTTATPRFRKESSSCSVARKRMIPSPVQFPSRIEGSISP